MNISRTNLFVFITLLVIYTAGQFLIGTYNPDNERFIYNAPADVDFLYYAAIINSVADHFPPQNPAMAEVKLTQPFIQYYPATLLAKVVNPYNSIRILNIIYLIIFGLLLYKLFPERYGVALAVIFASSAFTVNINALGVDLIARGFTHTPFFILLTIALYAKNTPIRVVSMIFATLINGYMMLVVIPFLIVNAFIKKDRVSAYLSAAAIAAMIPASLLVSSEAASRPFYFLFADSFALRPAEILKHAAPFLILSYFVRHRNSFILLILAVIFGSLIHYNPFFPVFLVYFAGAMMLVSGEYKQPYTGYLVTGFAAVLFIGFIIAGFSKYNPENRHYFPRYDDRIENAVSWLKQNTPEDAVIMALTADNNDLGLVMQTRPVYLGYIGHISHLGLDWKPSYDNSVRLYSGGLIPKGIDYIFYGPVERKYYPGFNLSLDISYRDNNAIIYKVPEN